MTDISVTALKDNVAVFQRNPVRICRIALGTLENAKDGTLTVVDPTNPMVFAVETAAVLSSAAMDYNEIQTSKLYPSMAQTQEDLYLHMSDIDYASRFSTPSRTVFSILLEKEELYSRAVDTGSGKIRKLVIPRNTEFTVDGYTFSMLYPIEIRIMAHGGLQVVYNVDRISPLMTLESNIVDWEIMNLQGTDFLRIDIPVRQFVIDTYTASLTSASGYKRSFDITDNFYYARAYMAERDGTWTEIRTTHTEQVYDASKPTVVLQVVDKTVTVKVPQVYMTTGLMNRQLRLDFYSTKGPLDLNLANRLINAFGMRLLDLDNDDDGVYSAPLSVFNTMSVFSDRVVTGGSVALTFEELRERVMTNSLGSQNVPITNAQLGTALTDRGYGFVKYIDNITKRQYLATRALPVPADKSVSTGAGCSINTIEVTLDNIRKLTAVRDNGDRVTITPDALFENVDNVINLVSEDRIAGFNALGLEARAAALNAENFLYTPFHYVLDITNDTFACRPYYLDSPKIASKYFIEENDTALVEVAVGSYALTRTSTGFKLTIVTRSGDTFKALDINDVYVQASFTPHGESDRAYLLGTRVGTLDDEQVYEFDLATHFDLDEDHQLYLTAFQMYDDSPRKCGIDLLGKLDIVFAVADHQPEGLESSNIDNLLGKFQLPEVITGVIREQLNLRFGYALTNLWSNSRSVISSLTYRTYETDVPYLYEENVFKRDATGTIEMNYDAKTKTFAYTLLHKQGDPVLDDAGKPTYRFRKGDIKLDANGNPIPLSTRTMRRQVDLLFIDGIYRFATATAAVDYRKSLPETIVGWLEDDIAQLSASLLEKTELFFYPKATLGNIDVLVKDGLETTIDSEQSFRVKYYMSKAGYAKEELRPTLTQTVIDTIAAALGKSTVAMSNVISTQAAKVGDEVLGLEITGLGGESEYSAITVVDDSARCTIRKKLVPLADGTLTVQDDVTVEYIRHTFA